MSEQDKPVITAFDWTSITTDYGRSKPMFPQDVPEVEPPVGTVAIFNSSFESGAGCSTNMMIRTERGWQERPGDRAAQSWEELTDLEYRNAEILKRNPNSTARFITVQVQIVAEAK